MTINYFSRGEFREKRMNMMDIYAIIRDGKFRQPKAGDEELQMTPTEILAYIYDNWKIDLRNQSNAVSLANYMRREGFMKGEGINRRKFLIAKV